MFQQQIIADHINGRMITIVHILN